MQGLANQVGAQRENIYNQQQAAPGRSLDEFLARVTGNQFGSVQNSSQNNGGSGVGAGIGGFLGLLGLLGK